jgi:transcriptional regulator with XRE-family HTH domain/tetratricopeptide (TPR) repeat protein
MPQSEGRSGFGTLLLGLRNSAGLSQEELGRRSGLADRTIARLEQGHSQRPHPDSARRLAEALQLRDAERAEFMACARRLRNTPDRDSPDDRSLSDGVAAQTEGALRDSMPAAGVIAPRLDSRSCAAGLDSTVGTRGVNGGFPPCPDQVVIPRQSAAGSQPRQARPGESHPGFEPQDPESARIGSRPTGSESAATVSAAILKRLCQLPPDISDFTGRSDECGRLAELLVPAGGATAVPVAVVSGPPGVGKTSIALHVAHALREHFPDGQLYVQLAGASASPRTVGEVLGELLRALGVPAGSIPGECEARAALLRSCLADQRVLLLADDAASAAQVRMLIPGTAGCAVIITSRDRLAGLAASHVHLDSLQPGEALQMLGRIAGEERVAADSRAAAGLVAACGHLPLAVRIAGARLVARPSWPVATLAAMVTDERQRLDELTAGDLAVRANLEVSYQALPPRARTAFRLLSLAGPFDVAGWTVAVVLGSDNAADVVNLLADKSMLGAAEVDAIGQPRYRLHDLLRDYASEQLASEPRIERAAALERLLHAWLQLSRRADQSMPRNPYLPPAPGHRDRPILPQQTAAALTVSPAEWFSTERLNLRHITALACADGHPALGLQLVARQAAFHHSQARFDEAEQLWRIVSKAARNASDAAVAAHATFGLAITRALQGYHAEVSGEIGQCATAFAELGDERALAWAMYWQADCAWVTGRHPEALEYIQQGLDIARRNQEPHAEIALLRTAAMTLGSIRGRQDEAIASAERALDLARQAGELAHELDTLRMLAFVNYLTGRYPLAERTARQGIDLADERNYVADRAYFLGVLGDACHALGRYQDAVDAFGRALPTFREHGLRRHEALCLLKMAESHLALGDTSQARPGLIQCQPMFNQLQMPAHAQRAQKAMANILCASG